MSGQLITTTIQQSICSAVHTVKDGIRISKFSKEAMEIGFDVGEELKRKVYDQFTSYVGEDSVFPTKNGSPKILTKFVNHPYSYELLPEY